MRLFLILLGSVVPLFFTAAPLFSQYSEVPNPEETVGIIRLSDMGTHEVLDMLERFTGKSILRQQNLPAVKINFSSQGPMKKWEAVLALESLLSLNGVAITELGENFLKAVPAASIGTQVPGMIGDSTLDKTPSQKIYSKFFRLNYLTTAEAIPLLQPLLSQGAPVAFEKSNSIMVTDALVNLQRIETILLKIDLPSKVDVDILFFPLKNVAASELVKRLETMQSGILKRYMENNTTFAADDRTNQLIVFTHPSNEKLIRDFIEKLDVDVAPLTQTEVFSLQHADATEVTDLIEQVITGQQQAREESSRTGGRQAGARPQQGQRGRQAQGAGARSNLLGGAGENLQFSDFVRIVADPRSNSIVAYGTPSDLLYLREIVDKIDVLLAQVRIEVVIAEVNLNKGETRGLDSFGINFNTSGANEINITGLGNPNNDTGDSGLRIPALTIRNFSIDAVLNTARSRSDINILSAPTIVTTHNQEATVTVGESRPVITASQTDSTNLQAVRSNVQFRDIGITLTVKPLIGSNGDIQMEIDQKVESVVSTVMIGVDEQPIIGLRQASSFVSVKDGEMVILAGLQQVDKNISRARLSLLGRLPIIGGLFEQRTADEVRRELIMFIQPHILANTTEGNKDAIEKIQKFKGRETLKEFSETGTIEETIGKKKKRKRSI